ncbi:type II toxin-antitoxin system VapC family toxin [Allonocardiopsis opalescens]|uniref:PIN domain nuclease of toxin-antitoxin system n=1 Tax=Allonocardiopsis opalescens TaxID=1144618 RepID=A0A2T0PVU4_9ACTN|nr:type II toxin-antitoxin system VapC family toxin [Allonocardiopsis opalescens]PRX95649.1 PIN domain nuclease of toxin-antitoxin system [Allonocardiopsis opalescens]
MRLLLDTHVLLCALMGGDQLKDDVVERIRYAPQVLVSAVSIWEIEIKRSTGKLSVPDGYLDAVHQSGFLPLPVSWEHARESGTLPFHLHPRPGGAALRRRHRGRVSAPRQYRVSASLGAVTSVRMRRRRKTQ